MASDNTELSIKDVRSHVKKDTEIKIGLDDLQQNVLNHQHAEANRKSQKNAEHDAKYGDASDAESSRLAKYQLPGDAHVPQG